MAASIAEVADDVVPNPPWFTLGAKVFCYSKDLAESAELAEEEADWSGYWPNAHDGATVRCERGGRSYVILQETLPDIFKPEDGFPWE